MSETAPQTIPVPGPRRAAVIFVFITIMLDMLAMGMIIPVLPSLVTGMTGGDAAHAATMLAVFGTGWALMQFIFSPILGGLSDQWGRRPIILFSNAGLGVDYIFMALAPSLWFLFVGRLISGITSASFSTAYAYIADVTPPEKRAGAFGLMGAAFGVGFILGPAFGGLLGDINIHLPFWVAAGLSLANFCYGLFVLPESLPNERRTQFSFSKANPLGALTFLRTNPALLALAAVYFLYSLAHTSQPSIFALYAGHRYDWGTKEIGLMLSLVGITSMIVQALLVGRIVKRFGERRTMIFALACGAIAFGVYSFANEGWQLLAGIPFGALMGLFSPSAQGMMSRKTSPNAQGQLQGAIGSLQALSSLIGPAIFAGSFAFAIGPSIPLQMPGIPFFIAMLLLLSALLLTIRQKRPAEPAGTQPPA